MALLALTEHDLELVAKHGALTVRRKGVAIRTVPVDRIDEVHLYGGAELRASARILLLREGVDVVFLSPRGEYRGRLLGPLSNTGGRRAAQHAALADPSRAAPIARAVVTAKLHNQRQLLLRLKRHHRGEALVAATVALRRLLATLRGDGTLAVDTVRGIEGQGASVYFRGLGAALANGAFTFARRTRRPPRDPFNACLSFGYTFLLRRAEAAVLKTGLDLYVGALHLPSRGQPSMALDLMEAYRPVMVDRLVLRMFNLHQLGPDDFENPDVTVASIAEPEDPDDLAGIAVDDANPAVYLGRSGRAVFIPELLGAWRQPTLVPARSARFPLQQLLAFDAYGLAAHLEDPESPFEPFTWEG